MLNLTAESTHVEVKFRFLIDEPHCEAPLLHKAWIRHSDVTDSTELGSIGLGFVV